MILKEYYLTIRSKSPSVFSTRTLESLVRMAEAHAKIFLYIF
ncbi:MAG: hypothetical protein ACFFBD_05560 [Candidatus Hodarchaeota archaeon]